MSDDLARPAPEVELVELSPAVLHALALGNLAAANRQLTITLTPYFVAPESIGVWRRRSRQLEADPGAASWITRAIVDRTQRQAVGRAGFHGPPDDGGMVEVGYAVDPAYRRRGYARAALRALLDRAEREAAVRIVRASIRPDNVASRRLVTQLGFVAVGEQWDAEDGREIIFEVDLKHA
ncbi:RimJ/RimL family protein N-acetyltransferase [Microlunatus panaciterrae]|uniref:RimJ/RimL family protein N-acetyltransferase n=1 Tax=Microlunatus panaciterrae TaxID=400768 RepID=A0ABS2RF31_9ACTN|nr:GNAT family N-acetyltransferase [Microlunatus panaciterrae]MBM7797567.1 RimJ/RimL family protein N-acetyltransferase [Microlunatus panaciterrae]